MCMSQIWKYLSVKLKFETINWFEYTYARIHFPTLASSINYFLVKYIFTTYLLYNNTFYKKEICTQRENVLGS